MLNLSFDAFFEAVQTSPVVSLTTSVILDMETAVSVVAKLQSEPHFVFLEGAPQSDRYTLSYVGLDPYLRLVGHPAKTELHYHDHVETVSEDVLSVIRSLKSTFQLEKTTPHAASPFLSGIMGYIHYEAVQFWEKVDFSEKQDLNQPLAQLMLPQTVILFDNATYQVTVVRNLYLETPIVSESMAKYVYKEMQSILDAWVQRLREPLSTPLPLIEEPEPLSEDQVEQITHFPKKAFLEAVDKSKDYIFKGHVFQIQISRRVSLRPSCSALSMYRFLRYSNPSPFMFFLQFGGYQILGSSPEILVGVENGVAKIRPLAGTRKRYASDKTESQIMEELLSDEKERAEHVMLVDLARNDLGRVCEWGSVSVNELMVIEKYRHVMHIVSDVTGVLKPECDSVDAFQYGFPAGTVSGTPKVRAMEIISELEPVSRQFYAGGVVFFDFYDNLKSTLVIRSIAIQDGVAYTQAAAGIVADSIPEMEYFETQNKMRSALQAMSLKEPR